MGIVMTRDDGGFLGDLMEQELLPFILFANFYLEECEGFSDKTKSML